jgi:hypothetical protein
MEIRWIYYGFSGAIANFVVWISLFFPVITSHNFQQSTVLQLESLYMDDGNVRMTAKQTFTFAI